MSRWMDRKRMDTRCHVAIDNCMPLTLNPESVVRLVFVEV